MSIAPREPEEKFCFTYCGDDRCTCGAKPIDWPQWRPSEKCLAELEELRQAHLAGVLSLLKNPPLVD